MLKIEAFCRSNFAICYLTEEKGGTLSLSVHYRYPVMLN